MNNIEEIIAIALVVALFLLNTGRALKAIELCKENLFFLNYKVPSIKQQLGKLFYGGIYEIMFKGYCLINDDTSAITFGKKLLVIYCEWGKAVLEGNLSIKLAQIYERQKKYVEAKELNERAITIKREIGNRRGEAIAMNNLGLVFKFLGKYVKAKECYIKSLAITVEIGDRAGEATCYEHLGIVFISLCDYVQAKEYLEKALAIAIEIGDREGEARCFGNLGSVLRSLCDYAKAKEYLEKALAIAIEIGDRAGQVARYRNLGSVFILLCDYAKAKEYVEKALAIAIEIGNRTLEGTCYENLGNVFISLCDYVKAEEYFEKALATAIEIGDRTGEATCYVNLGNVFTLLCDYVKAKKYLEKALATAIEIGNRTLEGTCFENLGNVFTSLCDYVKAKEYLEKGLAIAIKIGDRTGEATCYVNLGNVSICLCDYVQAKEYLEKALAIAIEIGDRKGEARCFGSLGSVFGSLCNSVKAKEYLEKALAIAIEIGDRAEESTCYANLGSMFRSFSHYVKAKEHLEKALAIKKEIGDRAGEAAVYGMLGTVFESLCENGKAKKYHEKAFKITREIDDRAGEAAGYISLGNVYVRMKKYWESKKCFAKALAINMEIGNRAGEAEAYKQFGILFQSLGDTIKAKQYYENALAIAIKIENRAIEAYCYVKLGVVFFLLDDYIMAEEYLGKALPLIKDTGDGKTELQCYCYLALMKLSQEKFQEAFSYQYRSVKICEDLRGSNVEDDQISISFADLHGYPYELLSEMFCITGNPCNALYVVELGRARVLADLMASQYTATTHISADPQLWIGIENVMKKESNCTCLYISYFAQTVFFWVLKTSGVISFREITVDKKTLHKRFARPAEFFRSFGILPEEVCEDRSLNDIEPAEADSSLEEGHAALRRGKDEENPEPSLTLFYELLINPVSDLLEKPEIIIVPDRNLYRVPFAALLDKSGNSLSETFRIRIVPSLTTLKLIQDSPADYHSQTGALIVGDPDVGDVIYNGRLNRNFVSLPGARNEAEMIGRLLGVESLLGKHATKEAVLQRIASVSLIHFAAHGNAERGEIALSPPRSTAEIPQEDDYLLKMSDISKVQLRAKLVVLSCCHSARGQIKAEGVVGIARAFLGSGARSVLVALWALEDIATKQFMSCFYYHLVRGESASESLHKAMKWMRDETSFRGDSFTKVSEWAPFMLIGDNVTFDFSKSK